MICRLLVTAATEERRLPHLVDADTDKEVLKQFKVLHELVLVLCLEIDFAHRHLAGIERIEDLQVRERP
jgi:hypothetical protein